MEALYVTWTLAVAHGMYRLSESRDPKLGRWIMENRLEAIAWTVTSHVFLVVALVDSPLLPDRVRYYTKIVTESVLWQYSILIAILLCLFALIQTIIGNKNEAPIPRITQLAILVTVLSLATHAYYDDYAEHNCTADLHTEYIPSELTRLAEANFAKSMKSVIELNAATGVYTGLPHKATRAMHSKAHGCVRGVFHVDEGLKPRYQVGAFQPGISYPAWARFSNAAHRHAPDASPDARGIAVKLMGVPGAKVLETDELLAAHNLTGLVEQDTQDLLGISSDFFPAAEPLAYSQFVRALTSPSRWPLFKFIFPSINPVTWRLSFLWLSWRQWRDGDLANPLDAVYYSATPYRLGPFAVKFSWAPCAPNAHRRQLDANSKLGDDFLREAMRRQLDPDGQLLPGEVEYEGACLELRVQEQRHACHEPIEDPTRPWRGTWVRIGELSIPRQEFLHRDQLQFCHDLSFSPWHTLPEHRPMGAINLLRKGAYQLSAATRNLINTGGVGTEPTGNEVFSQPQAVSRLVGAGDVQAYDYAPYPRPFDMLPKHIKSFRKSFDFSRPKRREIQKILISSNYDLLQRLYIQHQVEFEKFATPDEYISFLTQDFWPEHDFSIINYVAKTWKNDDEFGRQFMSGVNPVLLTVAERLPEAWRPGAGDAARMAAVAGGASLDELMRQRRLFYADYEILADIETVQDRVLYAPIVLFYTHLTAGRKLLLPLAIQLTRFPAPRHNRIFVPPQPYPVNYDPYSPEGLVWLFAKMHVATADAQVHECVSHLAFTHLALEPIMIAFFRQLRPAHPLLQLLVPHFRETLAINQLGRRTLLHPTHSDFDRIMGVGFRGGLQLMQKAYRRDWSLRALELPEQLRRRGFTEENRDILPDYLFRDYSLPLWRALKEFVAEAVGDLYPRGDEQVLADEDVQGLARELADPDMAALNGDVPKLETAQELVDFVTVVIWSAAMQHSAVNYGQFDYYSFIPNRPLFLTKPMPADLRKVTLPYVMSALPQLEASMESLCLLKTLSLFDGDSLLELYARGAGENDSDLSTSGVDVEAMRIWQTLFPEPYARFTDKLKALQAAIDERNQREGWLYPYLRPDKISPSSNM